MFFDIFFYEIKFQNSKERVQIVRVFKVFQIALPMTIKIFLSNVTNLHLKRAQMK
jgi:hypothetical protein